jgi:general secretion pathway protein C
MLQAWQDRLAPAGGRLAQALSSAVAGLSTPVSVRRSRVLLLGLAALWSLFSLATLTWSLLPARSAALPPVQGLLNPPLTMRTAAEQPSVDIERLAAMPLFGDPQTAVAGALAAASPRAVAETPDEALGENARETRLPLILRGAIAPRDGRGGYAMIEYQGEQAVYAVGDELPVSGRVVLARVLPARVVLDNRGTWERLTLFEDTALSSQAAARMAERREDEASQAPREVEVSRPDLAAQYRERLYSDPQSLADVVQVAPVRQDGELLGYRLSPGRAAQDFAALGFAAGDVVTAVNGLSLADPANAMRLYQAMRTERAAIFELQRDGSTVVLNVELPDNGNTP